MFCFINVFYYYKIIWFINIKNLIVLIMKKVVKLLIDIIYNDVFGLCEVYVSLWILIMVE